VILEGNPAFTAPADLGLADLVPGVSRSLYLGQHEDETAALTTGYVAAAHYLESWGDARAWDGTASPVQPLIRPLYEGRTPDEVLALFAGRGEASAHVLLREAWRAAAPGGPGGPGGHTGVAELEEFWNRCLQRGLFPDTASPDISVSPVAGAAEGLAAGHPAAPDASAGHRPLELAFRLDPKVHDGRFAGNAWLQEMPEPATRLTWDNAALLSPATCDRLGIEQGEIVELAVGERKLRAPVFSLPGHVDDAVTLNLGYGRRTAAGVGQGVGVDAYRLRTAERPWLAPGVEVRKVFGPPREVDGEARQDHGDPLRHPLVTTQHHWSLEGREIALHATLEELRAHPEIAARHRGPVASLYATPPMTSPHQWAMTIDLAACTGCSACVIACQAENNVPVVGKDQVANGREMHWLRVDNYLTGTPGHLGRVQQPMLCQQCEKAPCEYVCPVNATVHSDDGLNQMVYNRCVGTRFCSNNCPYKVRRFNWFDFNEARSDTECLVLNPDVTVRERGVMEKCTYCVQRIRRTENRADVEGRDLATDEIRTACQQACPTEAIVFGSITDPESRVSKTRKNPRMYAELHDLGTQPRTRYLVKVTNPSPELERRRGAGKPSAGAGGRGRIPPSGAGTGSEGAAE
jgi:molybdopterin-containing oxidoreductase family iron-sulfur binding subunit